MYFGYADITKGFKPPVLYYYLVDLKWIPSWILPFSGLSHRQRLIECIKRWPRMMVAVATSITTHAVSCVLVFERATSSSLCFGVSVTVKRPLALF